MKNNLDIYEIINQISSDGNKLSEYIDAVSEFSNFYNNPENENVERRQYVKKITILAEDDLKSAKILYKNKMYPAAIYHLQQSVEKLVKAYMFYFSILNKKDLSGYVSHDTPKAFLKFIDKFKDVLNPTLSFAENIHLSNSNLPEISNKDILKFEKSIKMEKKQIVKMKSDEIKDVIVIADNLFNILNNPQNFDDVESKMLEIISNIKTELCDREDFIEVNDKITEIIDGIEARIKAFEIDKFKDFHSYIPTLYILSVITYPHATFSRYPNEVEYNETLGIIQCFDRITKLLDKTIDLWKINALPENDNNVKLEVRK